MPRRKKQKTPDEVKKRLGQIDSRLAWLKDRQERMLGFDLHAFFGLPVEFKSNEEEIMLLEKEQRELRSSLGLQLYEAVLF